MRQLTADGAPRKERTAACRLTTTRRMDVDVVPGRVVLDVLDQCSVNVLRASAERGGTRGSAGSRVEEGDNDRAINVWAALVNVGRKHRSGQSRDGDLPAHLVVPWIQRDQGQTTSVAAQNGRKWITSMIRGGESLGCHPGRNQRRRDDQEHDNEQLSHQVTSLDCFYSPISSWIRQVKIWPGICGQAVTAIPISSTVAAGS